MQETTMNKTVLAFAAATSMAVSVLAAPPAEARCWGCAVGVGVAAGVVAGAVVGSAIANSYGPTYVAQPGYVAYPGYAVGAPVGCPGGYWARRPVAFDVLEIPSAGADPAFSVRKTRCKSFLRFSRAACARVDFQSPIALRSDGEEAE
jgi:hypothetical protein